MVKIFQRRLLKLVHSVVVKHLGIAQYRNSWKKFELLEQVSDVQKKIRARRSRTADNMAAVAESVEETQGWSISCRSCKLGIPQTSLHYTLF